MIPAREASPSTPVYKTPKQNALTSTYTTRQKRSGHFVQHTCITSSTSWLVLTTVEPVAHGDEAGALHKLR